jgi:multidrug efflux pump subunit AcrA (membrane-fusion protein)
VVRQFAIHSVGGVVTSAAELMTIALERATLLVDGRDQPITPGMAVTAEIKTGRRRVIDYLLAPFREYAHDGMRER